MNTFGGICILNDLGSSKWISNQGETFANFSCCCQIMEDLSMNWNITVKSCRRQLVKIKHNKFWISEHFYSTYQWLSPKFCAMLNLFVWFHHCVKRVRIRSYSGPHFSHIFLLSNWIRRDRVSLPIQSECGKIREKCDQNNFEYGLFLSLCIQSECGKNADQNKSEYGLFLTQCMFYSTKNTKFLWVLNNPFHCFSKTKWNKISSYRTHHTGSKLINKWNTANVFILNKGKHFQKYDLNTCEKRKCNHKMSSKTCRIDAVVGWGYSPLIYLN